VTIQASMADQSAAAASVTATIQFGTGSLAGQYVFSIQDDVGHAVPAQAGTLVFDGAGKISGGMLDSADKPGAPQQVTGGSYTVGGDGRGTATVQIGAASIALQLVMTSHAQAFVTRTDSGANQAAGTLDLQQNLPGGSTLSGAYALSASGVTTGASPARFVEAGSIVASGGTISAGSLDVNSSTAPAVSVTGSFTQPSGGRGMLALSTTSGAQTFVYYPIDGTRAKLVAADGTRNVLGDLFSQPSGPFTNASVKGRFAFSVAGSASGSGNPFGVTGVFSLDGNVSVRDQVFDGIQQAIVSDFNPGSYSVTDSASGRTTMSWTSGGTTLRYVLYPRSDGGFVILESDGTYLGSGVALPQADLAIANFLNVQGGLAFDLGGSAFSTPSTAERFTGEATPAAGNTLIGTVDEAGTQGAAFTFNLLSSDTSRQRYVLGVSSDSGAFAGGSLVLYRINDSQAFIVESSTTRIRTGFLQRQY
jgi:hypothetical protein